MCIRDREYKDAPVIYVMSSGATQDVAYTFSLCLMMEMQWVNSGNFNDGEDVYKRQVLY